MFNAKKNLSEEILVHDDRVDLSRANYSPELSSTNLDAETQSFHVTIDRVSFKKPVDIVTTVLNAHGFAINLENILSSLDQFVLGVKVKMPEKSPQEGRVLVRNFLPCVHLTMPNKSKVGTLLKLFYAEIQGYEQEIARLQDGELKKDGEKVKSREQLQKEIEKLSIENSRLQSKVTDLTNQLTEALKFQANANRALASQNIIPPQLRLAQVRDIIFSERSVLLRAGRTNISLPMALLEALPKPGDTCLLNVVDGTALGAFFYESRGVPFLKDMAEVLSVSSEACKVRDSQRKQHILRAQNETEKELFSSLKRGQKIILYRAEDLIIKVDGVGSTRPQEFTREVQELIALFQIAHTADDKGLAEPLHVVRDVEE